jgi:hypothetical protein
MAGNVIKIGKTVNSYTVLVMIPVGKHQLGREGKMAG